MNQAQMTRMHQAQGFIAALDQSGGSTPKALLQYGVTEDQYHNEEEMLQQVHKMRTRIIKSPCFTSQYILGAILFENTMDRKIDNEFTGDYLWNQRQIIPFLKIDKGLDVVKDGVQLMKSIPNLNDLLSRARERNIFGTKMRSVIASANPMGIKSIVHQQFTLAKQIYEAGLIPIIEPEVDIHSPEKAQSEILLKSEILRHLETLPDTCKMIFKLSIPSKDNFYQELMNLPQVLRVVALSGGYSREEANTKLAQNHGLIASFSRALAQGLDVHQSQMEFDKTLETSITAIYQASIT